MTLLNPHTAPAMGRAPRYKHKIASLRKNSCERLEITLEEYNGADLLNLAVRRDDSGRHALNHMKGTARFVSVNVRLLPDLIEALQAAERQARSIGIEVGRPATHGEASRCASAGGNPGVI